MQSILLFVFLICCGLFFISVEVTKRINTIVATADHIIATRDLTQRIPIDNLWDDLSKLSHVLNIMLGQIEDSVTTIRQVSDNIAHDLRTPLTRLRNHIETMRMRVKITPTTLREQEHEFNELMLECDALLITFNALLRISNVESGRGQTNFEHTNLAPVVEDAIALYEPIAAEKNITLTQQTVAAFVAGDKDLLFQALANVLDNAIKHTPPNGSISLTLTATESGATLTLADSGSGIADAHKPHVFRRFYRAESSRSTPGCGLGLSLVQAIVKLHNGTISLSDNTPHGLLVTITL
jgi:signal transduction histidine kinase